MKLKEVDKLKIGWIVLLTLLAAVVIIGSYSYSGQRQRGEDIRRERERLSGQLAQLNETLAQQIVFLKDEFPARGEKFWFLEKINELAAGFKLQFISIGPMEREVHEDYIQTSRWINLKGKYPEILRFINNLEEQKGLVVDNLKIEPGPEPPSSSLRAQFRVNSPEIKEDLESIMASDLKTPKSLLLAMPLEEASPVTKRISGDPFQKPISPAPIARGKAGAEELTLTLSGVLSFPSHNLAIIEDGSMAYIVKEGERVGDKKVVTVQRDKVILSSKYGRHVLRLKGPTTKTEKGTLPERPERIEGPSD